MIKGYFQTPNVLLEIDELDIYQKMVLICLYRTGNQDAPVFPSYKTIARRCSACRSKAISTVKELEKLNLLCVRQRKKKGGSNSNLYSINNEELHTIYERRGKHKDVSSDDDGASYGPGSARGVPEVEHDVDPIKNPNKEPDIKNYKQVCSDRTLFSFYDYIKTYGENHENEAIETVEYYVEKYRSELDKKHRKMKSGTWRSAIDQILDLYRLDEGEPVFESKSDYETIACIIDGYFKKRGRYEQPCDYSLPHFNSPGVKGVLFWELLY